MIIACFQALPNCFVPFIECFISFFIRHKSDIMLKGRFFVLWEIKLTRGQDKFIDLVKRNAIRGYFF